jgi:hypothetical protein
MRLAPAILLVAAFATIVPRASADLMFATDARSEHEIARMHAHAARVMEFRVDDFPHREAHRIHGFQIHERTLAAERRAEDIAFRQAALSGHMMGYLLQRRALDPVRFDFFHPRLGMLLARESQILGGLENCIPHQGLLVETPLHRALHRRHDLNPARFDHFHPILGALLEEDDRLHALSGCPPMPQSLGPPGQGATGSAGGSSGTTGGGGMHPTPEPATVTLAGIAGITLLAYHVRIGRGKR